MNDFHGTLRWLWSVACAAVLLASCSAGSGTPNSASSSGGGSGSGGAPVSSASGGSGPAGSGGAGQTNGGSGGAGTATGGTGTVASDAGADIGPGAGTDGRDDGGIDSPSTNLDGGDAGTQASGGAAGGPSAGSGGGGGGQAGSAGKGGTTGTAGAGGHAGSVGAGGGASITKKAFMVVLPTAIPTAGDSVMAGRLTAHGFQVTYVSDKTVSAQTVAGADLVVISSSAESGNLGTRLKDIAIPIFCIENGQYPNQAMAPTGKGIGEDSVLSQTQVAIIAPNNPMAGGLSGNVVISTKAGELGWGAPPTTATTVATVVGQANHIAIFGFAKGDQMVGMTAPARRAGFAIREDLAANLSSSGIKLFDAIVDWVMQ